VFLIPGDFLHWLHIQDGLSEVTSQL